jgi:two-component system, NarL family, response regulator NreC
VPQNHDPQIRLLLVDDHEVVRSGLRMLLENQSDMLIIGEASTARQAILIAQELNPDIILMDITLPDFSGIEATRQLQKAGCAAKIIALTIHEDEQFFFEMLKAGASGYVSKRAAPDDLMDAIRTVHHGEVYIYPQLTKLLVDDFLNRANEEPAQKETFNELTPREQEILVALAGGESNDEIAEKLSISRFTVARHRENLMRKLELHSRSELVKYAIRKGLINP